MSFFKKLFKEKVEIDMDRYLQLVILENRVMTLKKMAEADKGPYMDRLVVRNLLNVRNTDDTRQ